MSARNGTGSLNRDRSRRAARNKGGDQNEVEDGENTALNNGEEDEEKDDKEENEEAEDVLNPEESEEQKEASEGYELKPDDDLDLSGEEDSKDVDRGINPRSGLPYESRSDLRPYPGNNYFVSEKVLCEELRERVYNRVVEQKQSVSTVSAALGIEMRRVGAVVRLKAVEKEWIREVSVHVCCISPSSHPVT